MIDVQGRTEGVGPGGPGPLLGKENTCRGVRVDAFAEQIFLFFYSRAPPPQKISGYVLGLNGSDNLHPNSVDHLQGPVFLILSVKLQMAYRSDKNNL